MTKHNTETSSTENTSIRENSAILQDIINECGLNECKQKNQFFITEDQLNQMVDYINEKYLS